MITEETKLVEVSIAENGTVYAGYLDIVFRDGTQIACSPRRKSFMPGADISDEPQKVKDHCALAWTDEVLEAWQAALAAASPPAPEESA